MATLTRQFREPVVEHAGPGQPLQLHRLHGEGGLLRRGRRGRRRLPNRRRGGVAAHVLHGGLEGGRAEGRGWRAASGSCEEKEEMECIHV